MEICIIVHACKNTKVSENNFQVTTVNWIFTYWKKMCWILIILNLYAKSMKCVHTLMYKDYAFE